MPAPDEPPSSTNVALDSDEADYSRLFHLSLDLLCVAGLDGYFRKVNPAWTEILGWTEAELLSRPIVDFMHPGDRERTLQARARLAEGLPLRGLENRYLCKNGSYRWLSWQSSVDLRQSKVFAVARDITEGRRADRERLVLSRLESTGILAAGIAHDFNNLLGSLLLNLELVSLAGATTSEQQSHLQHAMEAVNSAAALTRRLLTFAQGGIATRRPLELGPLLEQSLEITLDGSPVRGECIVAPDLWLVNADDVQVGEVVRALLLNAREAMPEGGSVAVRADNVTTASPLEVSARFVRITVTDTGPGINPDILPKVFGPYFTTKPRSAQKGVGLGLSICRTIVEEHGGTIAVESQPGEGTAVTVQLPAIRPPDRA